MSSSEEDSERLKRKRHKGKLATRRSRENARIRQQQAQLNAAMDNADDADLSSDGMEIGPEVAAQLHNLAALVAESGDEQVLIVNEEELARGDAEEAAEGGAMEEPYDSGLETDDEDAEPLYVSSLESESDLSSEDEEEEPGVHNLQAAVTEWYRSNITLTKHQVNDLLRKLRKQVDPSINIDAHTLQPKIDPSELKYETYSKRDGTEVGRYCHIGLPKHLKHVLRGFVPEDIPGGEIELALYVDGVKRFKKTKEQFWPVVARITNVPLLESKRLAIGVYYGTEKCSPAFLLKKTIKELLHLERNGIRLGGPEAPICRVKLVRVVSDAPARAYLKNIISHSGFQCCERCDYGGEHPPKRHLQQPEVPVPDDEEQEEIKSRIVYDKLGNLRTNESFRQHRQPGHHHGRCVFEQLTDKDMIYLFPIEVMHLVYLGVVKRWLEYVLRDSKHFIHPKLPPATVSRGRLTAMQNEHLTFREYCPSEFSRRPEVLETKSVKATE